jgi:hypothetical protein
MKFSNKHVFIISDRDIFFNLFADALVQKCNVSSNDIIAIVYNFGGNSSLVKNPQFNYIEYKKEVIKELSSALTITSISLNSKSAEIVKAISEYYNNFWNSFYILITDDEIDRWRKNSNKENRLLVNKNQEIDENVLFVLSRIENFIVAEKYFKNILENILNRENFKILNASFIFDILPITQSELIKQALISLNYQKQNRLLLGSKGFSLIGVFNFIRKNYKSLINLQVIFFPGSLNRRIIIDLYLIYLKFIYKKPLDFVYLGKLNSITYNVIIASCNYFVLQDRGGASTARLYVKWGSGRLLIKKGSPNERYFSEVYNLDCLDWESESLSFLNDEIENKIILENSLKVIEEEKRSIQILHELYSNIN